MMHVRSEAVGSGCTRVWWVGWMLLMTWGLWRWILP